MNFNTWKYLIFQLFGIWTCEIVVILKEYLLGTLHYPIVYSLLIPWILIFLVYFFRYKFESFSVEKRMLLSILIFIFLIFTILFYWNALVVVFIGFSIIITFLTCSFIYIDKFADILDDIKCLECNMLSINKESFIRLLNDNIKFLLDKNISIVYWLTIGVLTILSVHMGVIRILHPHPEEGSRVFRETIIWATGFLCIYFYCIIFIFLWNLIPVYNYLRTTRRMLKVRR